MSSRGVNKVIILGNLGQDPDVKFTPSGSAVVNLTLATSESWKDKNTGEKQDRTEWHRCVGWGKTAEIIGEYVKKGDQLFVEGKLQTKKYQKNGVDHYSTEIVIDKFQFIGGNRNQGGQNQQQQQQPQTQQQQQQQTPPPSDFDDDLPF